MGGGGSPRGGGGVQGGGNLKDVQLGVIAGLNEGQGSGGDHQWPAGERTSHNCRLPPLRRSAKKKKTAKESQD